MSTVVTPPQQPQWRQRLEGASRPLLLAMAGLPRWVLPVAVAGLLILGVLVDGPLGVAALVLVTAALLWLLLLSWPALRPTGRLLRIAVIALLVYAVASRLTGGG